MGYRIEEAIFKRRRGKGGPTDRQTNGQYYFSISLVIKEIQTILRYHFAQSGIKKTQV